MSCTKRSARFAIGSRNNRTLPGLQTRRFNLVRSSGVMRVTYDRVVLKDGKLVVWAWDRQRSDIRQLEITGVVALIDCETGEEICDLDLARWLSHIGGKPN